MVPWPVPDPPPPRLPQTLGAREQAAGRVERATAAVEDQVVIAAHLVHVGQRDAVAPRDMAQHSLPHKLLSDRKRRGRKIEDGFRAGFGQDFDRILMIAPPLPEIAIVPNVFADADPEPRPFSSRICGSRAGSK